MPRWSQFQCDRAWFANHTGPRIVSDSPPRATERRYLLATVGNMPRDNPVFLEPVAEPISTRASVEPEPADSAPPIEEPTTDPQITALTHPAEGVPPVIEESPALTLAVAALARGSGPVAIDAERAGGYRYDQRAYLIQLRREGSGTHLIDPIPFADLAELNAALADCEWILHAASQDLACLAELLLTPTKLFDTEVAARLLGRDKVGLATLAETELGFSLAKEHSAADWSQRPLPESWLRYAALDVELLVDLRSVLVADLERLDRMEWANQEFEYLRTAPAKAPRVDPWRRTSGIHKIRNARQLAIVQQLWLQRDRLARDRDIAPGRVLPDAAIAAAAIAKPKTLAELAALKNFQGRGTRRRIDYWWEPIAHANSMPESDLPDPQRPSEGPPPPRSWTDRAPVAASRLARTRAALTALSEELGVPTENLLTPDTVRRLCWSPPTIIDASSVTEFLQTQGAREWQVRLCHDALVTALCEAG